MLVVIPVGSFVLALRYLVEVATTATAIAKDQPLIKHERGPTID